MKQTLLRLIQDYNEHARKIGDYEIDFRKRDNKESTYQIVNLTENGDKHKYAGTLKEVCIYLIMATDYDGILA